MTPYFDDDEFGPEPPGWSAAIILAVLLAVLFVWLSTAAKAADARSIRVVDGDTFDCVIDPGFDLISPPRRVRIAGFDAWEATTARRSLKLTKEQWAVELPKGKAAKAALQKLISEAEAVEVFEPRPKAKRDPWGRMTLLVYIDGKEAGELMRAQGHERK